MSWLLLTSLCNIQWVAAMTGPAVHHLDPSARSQSFGKVIPDFGSQHVQEQIANLLDEAKQKVDTITRRQFTTTESCGDVVLKSCPALSFNASTIPKCGQVPAGWKVEHIFGVIGDYGTNEVCEQNVANLIKAVASSTSKRLRHIDTNEMDFILTTGDNNYQIGTCDTLDSNIGSHYQNYFQHGSYRCRGTVILPNTYNATTPRFFPCLGNHDSAYIGIPDSGLNSYLPYIQYFDYLTSFPPGATATHPGFWYTYSFSPSFQIFVLDSNFVAGAVYNEQMTWLQSALKSSKAAFKLVYFHHNPYGTAQHDRNSLYMRVPYAEWGASMVMSGHSHTYERVQWGDPIVSRRQASPQPSTTPPPPPLDENSTPLQPDAPDTRYWYDFVYKPLLRRQSPDSDGDDSIPGLNDTDERNEKNQSKVKIYAVDLPTNMSSSGGGSGGGGSSTTSPQPSSSSNTTTTTSPLVSTTTNSPTNSPTNPPTNTPTTNIPTTNTPTTNTPTTRTPTTKPTKAPTHTPTQKTRKPTTRSPTRRPTTESPVTRNPTSQPTTAQPTVPPTTMKPTRRPTTKRPTTKHPTAKPTPQPTASPTVKLLTYIVNGMGGNSNIYSLNCPIIAGSQIRWNSEHGFMLGLLYSKGAKAKADYCFYAVGSGQGPHIVDSFTVDG